MIIILSPKLIGLLIHFHLSMSLVNFFLIFKDMMWQRGREIGFEQLEN